jgi:AcrR family transcriptional regulator
VEQAVPAVTTKDAPVARSRRASKAAAPAQSEGQATRDRVMDAALASILERGFYRASTNEIARRAGVTWGVIQHHFGTREALMVAVLRRRVMQFTDSAAQIELLAAPGEPRLRELFDILADNYGDPEYLAWLQILINLRHDPECSPEIGEVLGSALRGAEHHLGRLIRQALGPAGEDADFRTLVFSTMRGLSLSELLLEFPPGMSIPGVDAPGFRRQRDLLVRALVGLAADRGLSLGADEQP